MCVSKSHTSNDDGLTDKSPNYISHSNCDTVDSVTLQLLYSVAGGGNTTTSPTISIITTAECSPHHLIAIVTSEPLGTLQEREMEVAVMEVTLTLAWPGAGTEG